MNPSDKIRQVHAVFSKAIDVTIDSIGPNEVDRYFGDIKHEFGGQFENTLMNKLNSSRENIEIKFATTVEKSGLRQYLETNTTTIRSSTEPSNNIPPLDSVMLELLSYEEAELMTLIREAEKERSKLEEKLKKCDKDIQSQIEAIAEEEHKLENIVKQFSL